MSYYAKSGGFLTFKPMTDEQEKAFIKLVRDTFPGAVPTETLKDAVLAADKGMGEICSADDQYPLEFDLEHEYFPYDEDLIKTELNFFAPYLQYGYLVFVGEDDANWQFDFRNGKWHKDSAIVTFITDEPLSVNVKDETEIVIQKNGSMICITASDFQEIKAAVYRNIYYRNDVSDYLDGLVRSGKLMEEVLGDEAVISELVNLYADNRSKHDPDKGNFVWNHSESLEDAYNRCESINKYKKEN